MLTVADGKLWPLISSPLNSGMLQCSGDHTRYFIPVQND